MGLLFTLWFVDARPVWLLSGKGDVRQADPIEDRHLRGSGCATFVMLHMKCMQYGIHCHRVLDLSRALKSSTRFNWCLFDSDDVRHLVLKLVSDPVRKPQRNCASLCTADDTLIDASAKDLDRLLERKGSRTRARNDRAFQVSTDTRRRGGASAAGKCGAKATSQFEAEHLRRFVLCNQLNRQLTGNAPTTLPTGRAILRFPRVVLHSGYSDVHD
eukprot:199860-Prorocentrum_minimum.AAC.8